MANTHRHALLRRGVSEKQTEQVPATIMQSVRDKALSFRDRASLALWQI